MGSSLKFVFAKENGMDDEVRKRGEERDGAVIFVPPPWGEREAARRLEIPFSIMNRRVDLLECVVHACSDMSQWLTSPKLRLLINGA